MVSRSVQGIASALIMTTGMALVARVHAHDDKARGMAMSFTINGVAAGVSVGPPIGGMLFDIGGMRLPFLVVAVLTLIASGMALPATWLHLRWQDYREATLVNDNV